MIMHQAHRHKRKDAALCNELSALAADGPRRDNGSGASDDMDLSSRPAAASKPETRNPTGE